MQSHTRGYGANNSDLATFVVNLMALSETTIYGGSTPKRDAASVCRVHLKVSIGCITLTACHTPIPQCWWCMLGGHWGKRR